MVTNFEIPESGNWNAAKEWSNIMLFRIFKEIQDYLIIAETGCLDLIEDLTINEEMKNIARIKALYWARIKLINVLDNSIFAVHEKNDKKKLQDYYNEVLELKDDIKLIEDKIIQKGVYVVKINEEAFDIIFKCLSRINKEIKEPINKSDLIFTYKEQFDPKAAKERIFEEILESG